MISEADEAAIDAYVASLGIAQWPAISSVELDLLRRALASAPESTAGIDTAA